MRKMTTILVFALGVTSGLGVANAAFMPHGDNRAYFLGAGVAAGAAIVMACVALVGSLVKRDNRCR